MSLSVSSISDFSESCPVYWCVTVVRILVLKKADPVKYAAVLRMMDHNREHEEDKAGHVT